MITPLEITQLIQSKAIELGFTSMTVAKAEFMIPEAKRLEKWLHQGYHSGMHYMENHFEKRVDPTKLLPGTKTVISLSYNYFTFQKQKDPKAPKISMYAYGKDYHTVVKGKLSILIEYIKSRFGDVSMRSFVDSAPILERDWARRSGHGWIGKNTLLIHPKRGSYFFLAEILCDLEMHYDTPMKDYCGTCRKCIDACPTDALSPLGYVLDSNKCISYLTIEHKGEIPLEHKSKMNGWIFGCDICQKVCPWNRFSAPHDESDFISSNGILDMTEKEWIELNEETFHELFKYSAIKRTKYSGLNRNIKFSITNDAE